MRGVNSAKGQDSSVGGGAVLIALALSTWKQRFRTGRVQVEVGREEQGVGETHGKEQGEEQRENKRSTSRTTWMTMSTG